MNNRVFFRDGKWIFQIAASILMVLLFLCGCGVILPAVTQPTESAPASPSSDAATPTPASAAPANETPTPSPSLSPSPEITPEITPEKTPESTPEQSPPPQEEPKFVPDADSGFYDEFFDNAVFVGDSISQGLQNYVLYERGHDRPVLGKARFLAIAKYSLKTGAADFNPAKTNLTYQGVAMPLEDCLFMMEAREVYIMLGLNDWAGSNVPANIDKFRAIIEKVKERNPDIKVYIELCTPITENGEKPQINNENMDEFNLHLRALARELEIQVIDVSSPLKDENNFLRAELSRDDYVHLTNDGLRIWIDTLYEFARGKFIAGEWEAESAPEDFPGVFMTEAEMEEYLNELKARNEAGLEAIDGPDKANDETKKPPLSFK